MTARTLIPSVLALLLLQAPLLLRAETVPADRFDPTQTPDTGGDGKTPAKPLFILPSDKSSELVKKDDRSPFGLGEDSLRGKGEKGSNEENVIQEEIAKLRASGVGPGDHGLRLLLGDMILSEGDIMPAVIKDQTLALRVGKISRKAVELVWVEKKYTGGPPRVLTVPIDLRPAIRYVRHGQPVPKKEAKESEVVKRANAIQIPLQDLAGMPVEQGKSKVAASSPPPAPAAPADLPASAPAGASEVAAAPQADAPAVENSSLKFQPVAKLNRATADGPDAAAPDPSPTAEPAASPEPPSWKHAMDLINNLAKTGEGKK